MTDNSLIFSVMTQGCHNYNRDILTSQKYWNILNSLDKLWIGTKLTYLNELLLIRRLREGWWRVLSCCLVRHSVTISTPFPTWRLPEIWEVITRSDDTQYSGTLSREKQNWSGISGALEKLHCEPLSWVKINITGSKSGCKDHRAINLWGLQFYFMVFGSLSYCLYQRGENSLWVCGALESSPLPQLIDCPAQPNYHHQHGPGLFISPKFL